MANRLPSDFQVRRSWTVIDMARASLPECTACLVTGQVYPRGAGLTRGAPESVLNTDLSGSGGDLPDVGDGGVEADEEEPGSDDRHVIEHALVGDVDGAPDELAVDAARVVVGEVDPTRCVHEQVDIVERGVVARREVGGRRAAGQPGLPRPHQVEAVVR